MMTICVSLTAFTFVVIVARLGSFGGVAHRVLHARPDAFAECATR
jgi:hypothetical protein